MKKLLLFSLALFSLNALGAQTLIAVQHEGQSSFFTELQPALDAAVDGDTVYLPGATYGDLTLNKSLSLIGAGYFPDSATALNPTLLQSVTIEDGCGNGMLTGLRILGGMFISGEVHSFEVSRCEILGNFGFGNSLSSNFFIKENIIGTINFGGSSSHTLANNLVYGGILDGTDINISNNVIGNSGSCSLSNLHNSTITNNVILGIISLSSCISCPCNDYLIFRNNLSFYNQNGNYGTNFGNGNLIFTNQPCDVFVNYGCPFFYSYPDVHLVNPIYNTAGTDGSSLGIYGGLYPWKAGGVPYNPHIQTKTIAPTTNAQGSLNVQIRVAAQDH